MSTATVTTETEQQEPNYDSHFRTVQFLLSAIVVVLVVLILALGVVIELQSPPEDLVAGGSINNPLKYVRTGYKSLN